MKAYTVHNLWVCKITGQSMAQVSFSINDELQTVHSPFPSLEFANTYLAKSKRDWFLTALEKFVMHKKQIIESSHPDEKKQKALLVCITVYNDFCNKSLETSVKRFLNGKSFFEAILPNPNNSSFKSSESNLAELIKFCETETSIK